MGFTKKLHAESMERKAEREKEQAEYLKRKDVKERLEFEFLTAAAGLEDFIDEEGEIYE